MKVAILYVPFIVDKVGQVGKFIANRVVSLNLCELALTIFMKRDSERHCLHL